MPVARVVRRDTGLRPVQDAPNFARDATCQFEDRFARAGGPCHVTPMSARPIISIIIPTKDRAALLAQTLDSVRAQTYQDWEALVIDDHSKDETAAQMRDACERDSRIRFLSHTD